MPEGSVLARARSAFAAEAAGLHPRLLIAGALADLIPPYAAPRLRRRLLRLGGIRIGPRTTICGRLRIGGGPTPARNLVIGSDCMINDGVRFDTVAPIEIEDDVYIGHDVAILTASHEIGFADRRAYGALAMPARVGRGTWIGTRALVLPGATIGAGCVVAAGSVVTDPLPDNVLAAGIPARVARELGP